MAGLETDRLRLRQWTERDREPLARLNADPEVMRYFPAPLTRAESDAMLDRMRAHIDANGWGWWAAETREGGDFVGAVGLVPVKDIMAFAPAVEVGWRLAKPHWGRGYATEAAAEAFRFGFDALGLREILSFTAKINTPSQAVMSRLGMSRVQAFEHPSVDPASPLRDHWLYRRSRHRVEFACGNFTARAVAAEELPQLQRFYEANPGYFVRVEGAPPANTAARESLHGLPPLEWPFTCKLLIAFRGRDGEIAGVADVIADLLSPDVWHIGFFMAADRLHGSGVAHALYAHLEAWMRAQGARWLRLGVVRGNTRAERFWQRVGYVDVAERRDYPQGVLRHTLRVMAKPLAGGSLDEYRRLVPRDREPVASMENP
jgi:RimJ/RimL family protein N-acetyltransferase